MARAAGRMATISLMRQAPRIIRNRLLSPLEVVCSLLLGVVATSVVAAAVLWWAGRAG